MRGIAGTGRGLAALALMALLAVPAAAQVREELGMLPVVRVEEGDPVAGRKVDGVIARSRHTGVALPHDAHARVADR